MSPISIAQLDSWQPGPFRDGGTQTAAAAASFNGVQGEFTNVTTNVGATWQGRANQAMQGGANALAATLGGAATGLQTMAQTMSEWAAAVELAKSMVDNARELINNRHGLPLVMSPEGVFPPIDPAVAIVPAAAPDPMMQLDPGSGLGAAMGPQVGEPTSAPGWPIDIALPGRLEFYQGEVTRVNAVVAAELAKCEATDGKCAAALRASTQALVADLRETTTGAGTAFVGAGVAPWATVAGAAGLAGPGNADLGLEGLHAGDAIEQGSIDTFNFFKGLVYSDAGAGQVARNWGDFLYSVSPMGMAQTVVNAPAIVEKIGADIEENPGYVGGAVLGGVAAAVGTGGAGAVAKGGSLAGRFSQFARFAGNAGNGGGPATPAAGAPAPGPVAPVSGRGPVPPPAVPVAEANISRTPVVTPNLAAPDRAVAPSGDVRVTDNFARPDAPAPRPTAVTPQPASAPNTQRAAEVEGLEPPELVTPGAPARPQTDDLLRNPDSPPVDSPPIDARPIDARPIDAPRDAATGGRPFDELSTEEKTRVLEKEGIDIEGFQARMDAQHEREEAESDARLLGRSAEAPEGRGDTPDAPRTDAANTLADDAANREANASTTLNNGIDVEAPETNAPNALRPELTVDNRNGATPEQLEPYREPASSDVEAFQRYKDQLAREMAKPEGIEKPRLQELMDWAFRDVPEDEKIGNGSSVEAARHTRETGELVGESDHLQKVMKDIPNTLEKVLRSEGLSVTDRMAAENLLRDVENFKDEVQLGVDPPEVRSKNTVTGSAAQAALDGIDPEIAARIGPTDSGDPLASGPSNGNGATGSSDGEPMVGRDGSGPSAEREEPPSVIDPSTRTPRVDEAFESDPLFGRKAPGPEGLPNLTIDAEAGGSSGANTGDGNNTGANNTGDDNVTTANGIDGVDDATTSRSGGESANNNAVAENPQDGQLPYTEGDAEELRQQLDPFAGSRGDTVDAEIVDEELRPRGSEVQRPVDAVEGEIVREQPQLEGSTPRTVDGEVLGERFDDPGTGDNSGTSQFGSAAGDGANGPAGNGPNGTRTDLPAVDDPEEGSGSRFSGRSKALAGSVAGGLAAEGLTEFFGDDEEDEAVAAGNRPGGAVTTQLDPERTLIDPDPSQSGEAGETVVVDPDPSRTGEPGEVTITKLDPERTLIDPDPSRTGEPGEAISVDPIPGQTGEAGEMTISDPNSERPTVSTPNASQGAGDSGVNDDGNDGHENNAAAANNNNGNYGNQGPANNNANDGHENNAAAANNNNGNSGANGNNAGERVPEAREPQGEQQTEPRERAEEAREPAEAAREAAEGEEEKRGEEEVANNAELREQVRKIQALMGEITEVIEEAKEEAAEEKEAAASSSGQLTATETGVTATEPTNATEIPATEQVPETETGVTTSEAPAGPSQVAGELNNLINDPQQAVNSPTDLTGSLAELFTGNEEQASTILTQLLEERPELLDALAERSPALAALPPDQLATMLAQAVVKDPQTVIQLLTSLSDTIATR